jgi:hypothetical protein
LELAKERVDKRWVEFVVALALEIFNERSAYSYRRISMLARIYPMIPEAATPALTVIRK